MTLQNLIDRLQALPADTLFPNGFASADSWRGAYDQIAFEPATNTRAGDMLAEALQAVGTTYQGYKGGDYTMRPGTDVNIATYGCYGGKDDALTTWRWKCMLQEAVLVTVREQEAEIAALKAILASYIAYDESDSGNDVQMMLDYADMLAASRAAMSQAAPPTSKESA